MAETTCARIRYRPHNKYVSLLLMAAQRSAAYRRTTLFNIAGTLVLVAAMYYLWRAVFAGTAELRGFDWVRMQTYILISQAVNVLFTWTSESRMVSTIRTGDVATDLVRPVDYQLSQLAQAGGAALVEGGLAAAFALIVGFFILGVAAPVSWAVGLVFLVSVGLGFVVKFLISYIFGLFCFWTLNWVGVLWTRQAVTNIFSGALVPIAFFPDWLEAVAMAAPFHAIVHTPTLIYIGELQGSGLWRALGVQCVWIVALWWGARAVWRLTSRTLVIQGG